MFVRQMNLGVLTSHTNYHGFLQSAVGGSGSHIQVRLLRVQQTVRELPSLEREIVRALQILLFQR